MWVGFNSQTLIDNSESQIVDYLPQINMSPTSYSAILETLKNAQEIAKQCHQENIIVTYDLAIAKMAMKIQITESPKFDNIFINMGAFHIQMAFLKLLGNTLIPVALKCYLENAKFWLLVPLMVLSMLNTSTDANEFIHIISAVLQSLHFDRFVNENEDSIDDSFVKDLIHI